MTLFCIMHMKAAKRRQIRKTAKEVPCILAIQWVCLFSNYYQRHLTLGTRNRQRSLKRFSILFPMIEIQYSIWNIPGILVQVFSNLTFSKSLDEQSKIHGSYTWFPLLPSDIFSKRKRCWGTFLKQKYSRNDWSIFSELPTIYQNRKIYVFLQFCFRNIWYNLLLKVVMGITAFAVYYMFINGFRNFEESFLVQNFF